MPPPPPLQHGSPEPPHFMHAPGSVEPVDTQPRPVSQEFAPPPQHGSPTPPHFIQALAPIEPVDTQPRPLWHCDWPPQQGCPLPPQVSHIPGVAAVIAPEAPPLLAIVLPVHTPPAWHPPPAQHSVPVAPQFVHMVMLPVMTAHPRPVEQDRPLQQGCPLPPQVSHIPADPVPPPAPVVWQASPEPQLEPPLQQSCPLAPQAAHMPIEHRAPDAVHVVGPPPPPPARPPAPPAPPLWPAAPDEGTVPQQISPIEPHFVPAPSWHEPLVQVPVVPFPPMQADPLAWHRFWTQQPPASQVFAAQHVSPSPPQEGAADPPAPPVPPPARPAVPVPAAPPAWPPPVPAAVPPPEPEPLLLLEQAAMARTAPMTTVRARNVGLMFA